MSNIKKYLLLLLLPLTAQATGWSTTEPVIMYDAPSDAARPMLILSGAFPLKEISKLHDRYKVATYSGEVGWVSATAVKPGLFAVIISDRAAVRVDPHPAAAAVFFAKRGVVLEVLERRAGNGWMKVLHTDGEIGYLQLSDSWQNF